MSKLNESEYKWQKSKTAKIHAIENLFTLLIITSLKNLDSKKFSIGTNISDYEILGFVNCFQNIISTRLRCPVCATIQSGNKSRIFKTTKSCATHLVTDEHDVDGALLSVEQGLRIIELHSLMLQLRICGERI